MHIEHVAVWVKDLENSKAFYEKFFGGKSGEIYHNPKSKFSSYFITFGNSGERSARIEIMTRPDITENSNQSITPIFGYAHLAISVGSKEEVDRLTENLRENGVTIVSPPRFTGDGYYESVVSDPDGNLVEIVK
jgi:lactoylglutathione lyase